jgi:hypothetical protein
MRSDEGSERARAQMMSFSRCLIKVSCRIWGCVLRPLYICNEIKLLDAAPAEREREAISSFSCILREEAAGGRAEFIQLQPSLPNKRERISLSGTQQFEISIYNARSYAAGY